MNLYRSMYLAQRLTMILWTRNYWSSVGRYLIQRLILSSECKIGPTLAGTKYNGPAPVAQWLARRTVGRKVWGSNPIRVMWDFSALAGSYPELGVLWAQWEGWNHTAELHPLHGCVFEGVALIT